MVERRRAEVIVHVEDVRQEGLGGVLLHVHLLHLVLDQDCLPCDLLSWPRHPQQPRDPLKKKDSYLERRNTLKKRYLVQTERTQFGILWVSESRW